MINLWPVEGVDCGTKSALTSNFSNLNKMYAKRDKNSTFPLFR